MNKTKILGIITVAFFVLSPLSTVIGIEKQLNETQMETDKILNLGQNTPHRSSPSEYYYPQELPHKQKYDTKTYKQVKTLVKTLEEASDLLISDTSGNIRVLIVADNAYTLKSVETVGEIQWVAAIGMGKLLASVTLPKEKLTEVAMIDGVEYISPDFYIYNKNAFKEGNLVYKIEEESEKPSTRYILDKIAADILNAPASWNIGFNGSGITIAVVDTGVDFSAKPLVNKYTVEDNASTLGFVPDGDSVALTPYVLQPYSVGGKLYLPTKNRTFEFYDPFFGEYYTITLSEDYNVTGIVSKSGKYHLGFVVEWIPKGIYYYGFATPVLLTDQNVAGVYDTVWVDITFSLYNYATVFDLPINASWRDFVFEGPYYLDPNNPSKALVAVDVYKTEFYSNGTVKTTLGSDGFYDYSLGIIGVPFIDSTGGVSEFLSSVGVPEKLYYEGIDRNGNWVGFIYDFQGHGTSVATTAAGEHTDYKYIYANDTTTRNITVVGIAPAAKIMPVRALSWGRIIEGWFYATGFDLNYSSTLSTQIWKYTGKHKAHIISNSWGISKIWAEYGDKMYASDIVSLVETILSLNGSYLSPTQLTDPLTATIYKESNIASYKPSIFIHAVGNGGPGYGTANVNPYSPLAINVGASTTFHWRPAYTNETEGTYDQIIWWSARGPIVSGFGSPDVVAVGAYAFESIPPAIAGSGALSLELFGGTSQATPMVAGSIAIILQAYNSTFGDWSPLILKSLLMAGSEDVGYDVFSMGAGRINVNRSVSLALNTTTGDLAYIHSDFVDNFLRNVLGFTVLFNEEHVGYPYLDLGFLYPGSTHNTSLKPLTFIGDNDTVNSVSAYRLELASAYRIYLDLIPGNRNFSTAFGSYYMFDLEKLGVNLTNYDFARFTAYLTKSEYLDSGITYMAIWGYNGGTVNSQSDVFLVNRFTGYGNILTVDVSTTNIPKNLLLGFFSTSLKNTTVKVLVQLFKKVPVKNIAFEFKGDHDPVNMSLTVDPNALPGTYWGFINISTAEEYQLIPFIYHVVAKVETNREYSYTSTYAEANDSILQKQSGILGENQSLTIRVTLTKNKYYRFTLAYRGVGKTPVMYIVDPNQSNVVMGIPAGNSQISAWFKAQKGGEYTLNIINKDTDNKMRYTIEIVEEAETYNVGQDNSTIPNYSFVEGYDWSWRAEVGEWRFFYITVNDSSLVNVTVTWDNPASDATIHIFHYNTGYILAKQTPTYLGYGMFADKYYNTTSTVFPAKPGEIYVVAIRAPVISGITFPEKFELKIKAVKHSGPYIELVLEDSVIQYQSTLMFEAEIKSAGKLANITIKVDGVAVPQAATDIETVSNSYWIVRGEITTHSLLEGKHNLTITASDQAAKTNATKQFYVDSSPPMLTEITINNQKYQGEPVEINKNGSITVSLKIEDTTPNNIELSITNNFNKTINITAKLQFDAIKGKITREEGIAGSKATYQENTGRWVITINVTIAAGQVQEGYYMLSLLATDSESKTTRIKEKPIIEVEAEAPKILSLRFYAGEPPKTILNATGTASAKETNITVYLEKDMKYNAYLSWDNPLTDLDLYIIDPYGYQVASSLNYGPTPENITFETKITGNYTIKIVKYTGPETNYRITIREVKTLEEIKAINPEQGKVTLAVWIMDVKLSTVSITVNLHNYILTFNTGNASYRELGYYEFVAAINASTFNLEENNITITARDITGKESTETFKIQSDSNPPKLNANLSTYVKNELPVNITYWDNETSVKNLNIIIDGSLYTSYKLDSPYGNLTLTLNISDLSEGSHTVVFLAVDQALNTYLASSVFYRDLTPPTVSIINFSNNTEIGEEPIILFSIQDNVKASALRIYVNGTLYRVIVVENDTVIYQTAIGFKQFPGDTALIQLLAFDMAGNTISVNYLFKIDRSPPSIQIDVPNVEMIRDFYINITISDTNYVGAEIYIDGKLYEIVIGNTTIKIPVKVTEYADGDHTIKVIAYDSAGNTASQEKQFRTGYYGELINREKGNLMIFTTLAFVGGLGAGFVAFLLFKRFRARKQGSRK